MFLAFITPILCNAAFITVLVATNPSMIGNKYPFLVYFTPSIPILLQQIMSSMSIGWLAALIVFHDSLILYLLNQIRCQIQVLEVALHQLSIERYKRSPIEQLIFGIEHHQALIHLRNRTYKFFAKILLFQFLTSLLIIATAGFQVTITQNVTFRDLTFSAYCICILFQLFLYCFFANQVIQEVRKNHICTNIIVCNKFCVYCQKQFFFFRVMHCHLVVTRGLGMSTNSHIRNYY